MRSTLRIFAGMFLGVLIAWLIQDMKTPPDPRELAKHSVQIDVNGKFTPEEIQQMRQRAEEEWVRNYRKNQNPQQDLIFVIAWYLFFAVIFGMLAAYSLLFDFRTLGLMQRQRARVLDTSQL